MKRGLENILLSSFVLIFLATFIPGLASADVYLCFNPQTNQTKIVQSPSQCFKPSILKTFTNADIANLKTTAPSIRQNTTTKSARRVYVSPACKIGYTCYWTWLLPNKSCGAWFCNCDDDPDCNTIDKCWITPIEGKCRYSPGDLQLKWFSLLMYEWKYLPTPHGFKNSTN